MHFSFGANLLKQTTMTPLTQQEILEHQLSQAFGKFHSWTDYFKEFNLILVKIENDGRQKEITTKAD